MEDEISESQASELSGLEVDECPIVVELARAKNNSFGGGGDNNMQRKSFDRGYFNFHVFQFSH